MKKQINKIHVLLSKSYPAPRFAARKHEPLDLLIETILSQNTSDANSHRAFENLKKKFPNWEGVLAAKEKTIRTTIKSGGLAGIKAQRIQHVLSELTRRSGSLSLEFLKIYSPKQALDFLLSFNGIGIKTASVVLLFGFGFPFMPLDTHCLRVLKKLKILPNNISPENAHKLMNELVDDELKPVFHLYLIQLGRTVCFSRSPNHSACVLRKICPSSTKNQRRTIAI